MQITADISKIWKTSRSFIFHNHALGLSNFWFSQHWKMFLIAQKLVFIENEATKLCVTMWKLFTPTLATICHKTFWKDVSLIENRNCDPLSPPYPPPLQCVVTQKRDVPNPMIFLISTPFSISCTIPNLVVCMSQERYYMTQWQHCARNPQRIIAD